MNTKLIKHFVIAILGLAALASSGAFAAQATDQFQVQATVNANCLVTANDLTFGTAYDGSSGTPNDSTTTISVRCTKTTGYTVHADAGLTSGSTLATRLMTNGSDNMQYNLYTDAGYTTIWGDTTGGTGVFSGTGAGMGAPQNHTVYGRIPISQNLSPGTYTETTITVTVFY